jgi:hypothetical protein
VVDSSAVKVNTAALEGNTFALTIDSHTGHTSQLQRSASLSDSFTNVGSPKSGATGTVLTFTGDDATGPRGFYRIAVDP